VDSASLGAVVAVSYSSIGLTPIPEQFDMEGTLITEDSYKNMLKDVGGVEGQPLKIGRMEFFDGAEVSPKNETLAALKRDRVAARLLASFGFTHVQRSVDGVQCALDRPTVNVTLLAARPTELDASHKIRSSL
jgi:hypothetical protein